MGTKTEAERRFKRRTRILFVSMIPLTLLFVGIAHRLGMTGAQIFLAGIGLMVLLEIPGLMWCMWPLRDDTDAYHCLSQEGIRREVEEAIELINEVIVELEKREKHYANSH